jgi:hypothetical protein
LYRRVEVVIAPLAAQYAGEPVSVVRPALQQTWERAFDTELPELCASRCAAAIRDRTPWSWALWNDDWREVPPPQPVSIDSRVTTGE